VIADSQFVLAKNKIFIIMATALWTFFDYIEVNGTNPFARWIKGLPDDACAAVDDRLLQMESLKKWPEKWASIYRGREKIIELRIPFNRVQYRPLGMYSPHVRSGFVLLAGGIEKGGKIPKADLDTAERRRDVVLADNNRVVLHEL